jgi:transcriptional regulator with XRE-family HTH domain
MPQKHLQNSIQYLYNIGGKIATEIFVKVDFSEKICYNGVNFSYPEVKSMHLGEKIRQARLEAGLSQRQLCGDMITRNMLSQIENGSANPSMATLRYLSEQLGKSVGYFLQEDAVLSPNPELLQEARKAYGERKYAAVLEMGKTYKGPDPLFDPEWHYLCALCSLALAEQMVGLRDWIAA